MPPRPKSKKLKSQRRVPLYIVTLKNGQEYMTSDIMGLKKGTKIRKTPHFALTRRRLSE